MAPSFRQGLSSQQSPGSEFPHVPLPCCSCPSLELDLLMGIVQRMDVVRNWHRACPSCGFTLDSALFQGMDVVRN